MSAPAPAADGGRGRPGDEDGQGHLPLSRRFHDGRGWTGIAVLHNGLTMINNALLVPFFASLIIDFTIPLERVQELWIEQFNLVLCAFFGTEWVLGLIRAKHKVAYLRDPVHVADLVSAIPLSMFFQSIRVVRLSRVVRFAAMMRGRRLTRLRKRARQAGRLVIMMSMVVMTGAIAMFLVEPATVPRLEDAIWWSLVSVTTVGYGDIVPETSAGRIVGGALLLFGVGAYGYLAGFVSAVLTDPSYEDEQAELKRQVTLVTIEERLIQLNRRLDQLPVEVAEQTMHGDEEPPPGADDETSG